MNRCLVVCLALAHPACCVLAAQHTTPHHKAPGGVSCGVHCGTERWAIKTLTDADARKVSAVTPIAATTSDLTLKAAPKQLPQDSLIAPVENEQVAVKALLIAWKGKATTWLRESECRTSKR